ncbi:Uncharacterized protein OBRU01_07290 [Operophtera brumata]|uniref:Uncharacterized protein n=1 Tax=Operophtera brumata TaxID=104452 RepID=A0A0L7LJG4_OPEBR|nr:Uncharacterized protein OBRU01_07290 [Operophtera brumata]
MDKKEQSSESNFSIDSLEDNFKTKTSIKDGVSEDNIDTILVPFYDNDVLVKVPKQQKRKKEANRQGRSNDKLKELYNSSYLVNKDTRKARRTTYLERFRSQLSPQKVVPKPNNTEIRSLSPEVGDTEIESIGEDHHDPVKEFYNTESYNEIYYEKLLNRDLGMDSSYEEGLNKESEVKTQREIVIENLKSISEISQPKHHVRRSTVQPIQTVKLGGLGPDVERIKPRLERARSLQRYSEKVRMENRLRIYKKSVQLENEKDGMESSANQRNTKHEQNGQKDTSASYLLNKSSQDKPLRILHNLYAKSKSADVKQGKTRTEEAHMPRDKSANRPASNKKVEIIPNSIKGKRTDEKNQPQTRTKSNTRNKASNTNGKPNADVPPVQINFMVNVGGVRPSTALRNLEEKHRMYQEQVKAFKMENND